MFATQYKQESLSSNQVETRNSRPGGPLANSAAATLIDLGIILADASAPVAGFCFRCRAPLDSKSLIVQYPNAFCSKRCEQEFVRAAVASLTLQECIRIQHRLESLLMGVEEPLAERRS